MLIERARIDGTQIPTNIPPSLSPLNHRNTENKPIIKWHGYSSYPINYQKVWLNKLAMGEQLDP